MKARVFTACVSDQKVTHAKVDGGGIFLFFRTEIYKKREEAKREISFVFFALHSYEFRNQK